MAVVRPFDKMTLDQLTPHLYFSKLEFKKNNNNKKKRERCTPGIVKFCLDYKKVLLYCICASMLAEEKKYNLQFL